MKRIIALLLVIVLVVALAACGSSSSRKSYSSSSSSSSKHSCYVCGKSGSIKYGSHYYCSTHYAMVKTVVDAD